MKYLAWVTLTTGMSFSVELEANDAREAAQRLSREGVIRGSHDEAEYFAASMVKTVKVGEDA